jgi:hypothetical protein
MRPKSMKNAFSIFCIVLLAGTLNAQNWSIETTFPGNRAAKRLAGISAVVGNNLYFGLGLSPFSPFTATASSIPKMRLHVLPLFDNSYFGKPNASLQNVSNEAGNEPPH